MLRHSGGTILAILLIAASGIVPTADHDAQQGAISGMPAQLSPDETGSGHPRALGAVDAKRVAARHPAVTAARDRDSRELRDGQAASRP